MNIKQNFLKQIPQVDEILQEKPFLILEEEIPRPLLVDMVRESISALRNNILSSPDTTFNFKKDDFINDIVEKIKKTKLNHLVRVVNATGIVIHTNLGRSRLSKRSYEHVMQTAMHYSNLEYDLEKGCRGSRHDHVESLICKITGAEAAMVVNNNAAATILCLSTIASGKEVVVSRGELVEIGGSFRVTEIMKQSGAILRETGTTNKTRLSDYKISINAENTAALLKVHTSNFKIIGFTEEVELEALVALGQEHNIPVIYDMGNGLMIDLTNYGIDEPTVRSALKSGIDVLMFSGDKLLGGPQGGVIIGKKHWIDKMKQHPLARAFRVDKMLLAAMENTFYEYQDEKRALKQIPTLSMITLSQEDLKTRAEVFQANLLKATSTYKITIEASEEKVGGGTAPLAILNGYGLAISSPHFTADDLAKALKNNDIPIITRIIHDKVLLSMRTICKDEEDVILSALVNIEKAII